MTNFGAFGAKFALPMLAASTSFFAGGASMLPAFFEKTFALGTSK
ncbi:MAG: hypothetical protein ACYTXA_02885 [Nostoc sp.]